MRGLHWLFLSFILLLLVEPGAAQSSFFTGLNKTTFNVPCGTGCSQLTVQVPHLKSSSDYSLVPISYTPFAFVTPTGTTLSSLYADDLYSPIQALGFPFCFYDSTYNNAVVGSNGLITFHEIQANTINSYYTDRPIPYAGGTINNDNLTYYPPASIMAAYTDLDPRGAFSPTDRKIESRVEGVAPFRRYIASFYRVGTYGANACALGSGGRPGTPTTFQIVLYEQTGLIDIFIENKTCQSTTPEGVKTILGIQNFQRNKAVAAPRRNSTLWTASNEGWRFVPSGAISRYVKAELYDLAGTLVQTVTADTATTTSGLLDVNFNNVCFTGASQDFVLKTFFTSCPGGTSISSNDTITISRGGLTATATTTAAGCSASGTATITMPAGTGPYTYTIKNSNNVTLSSVTSSNTTYTFNNLIAGTYTVAGTNTGGCAGIATATVALNGALQIQLTPTSPSCSGNNGTVTVTPLNGVAPYQYNINNGTYQNSNVFANLIPGVYVIAARDSTGCVVANQVTTVSASTPVTATTTVTNVACNGSNTGAVSITPSINTVAPVQYSLDGVTYQASNAFSGLAAGNYTVYFRDATNCSGTQPFLITQPTVLAVTVTKANAPCSGGKGTVTATASGGTSAYQYSIDGTTFQASNTFNVPIGSYIVYVKDAAGCVQQAQPVVVSQPQPLTASAVTTNATCNGGPDGSITTSATGGTVPHQYAINGTSFQASPVFNVVENSYTVTVKDANGCTATTPAVVGLTNNLTISVSPSATICEGTAAALSVTTNAASVTWLPAATLNDAASRTPFATPADTTQYVVTATLGACAIKDSLTVNVRKAPTPNAGPDDEICFGQNYILQGSGGVTYEWAPATAFVNGNTATEQSPTVTPAQTTTYNLSVTDVNGCRSLTPDAVTITVTPPIKVIAAPRDTVVARGDVIQLRATSPVTDYTWSPAFGLDDASKQNPVATITTDVNYVVTAYTGAGCRGTDTVRIKVYNGPEIYVPTAFTPNGDGKNEWLMPFPVGIRELKYFRVYNRWGQLIFQTQTLSKGWDGKLAGVVQPTATYVWVLEAITRDGVTVRKRGTTTLIR